jgi:hypothetical protein
MSLGGVSKALFGRDLPDRSDVAFSSRIIGTPTALEVKRRLGFTGGPPSGR